MSTIIPLGDNVFLQKHPLSIVGCQFGRNTTVIRLATGKLLIHSTAYFSEEDVRAIHELGEPAWLLEATLYHDTLAQQGRSAFPDIPYLVPRGFPHADTLGALELHPENVPEEWADELKFIPIHGAPKLSESAIYHGPSKTLILADLIFNLPPTTKGWTRFFLRVMSGIKTYPGMSRLLKFCVKDRQAFSESLRHLGSLDFKRIIVAHGDPIEKDAKTTFLQTINNAGYGPNPSRSN